MTVCIGAICQSVDRIILVSDQLRADDSTSVEGVTKFHQIGQRWIAMVATDNLARFPPLMRRVESILGGRSSFAAVFESCQLAYAAELERLINQETLLQIGKTRDEIVEHGLTWFGEEMYASLMKEIRAATLATDLLVAGFDDDGTGRMLAIQGGVVSDVSEVRYYAIGRGWQNANGVLDPIANFVFGLDIPELIYRVLSAKFAAESNPFVGKQTSVMVISPNADWQYMLNSGIDKIREIWARGGQPPVPKAATEILGNPRTLITMTNPFPF